MEVPGSTDIRYFVFLSVPPSLKPDAMLQPYATWQFEHFSLQQIDIGGEYDDGDRIPRLVEFALDLDSQQVDRLPAVQFDYSKDAIVWPVAIRSGLGADCLAGFDEFAAVAADPSKLVSLVSSSWS